MIEVHLEGCICELNFGYTGVRRHFAWRLERKKQRR